MATVLVALAVTESRPSQINAGKETSVPPPATELMAPARNAAANATAARQTSRVGCNFEDTTFLELSARRTQSPVADRNARRQRLDEHKARDRRIAGSP